MKTENFYIEKIVFETFEIWNVKSARDDTMNAKLFRKRKKTTQTWKIMQMSYEVIVMRRFERRAEKKNRNNFKMWNGKKKEGKIITCYV